MRSRTTRANRAIDLINVVKTAEAGEILAVWSGSRKGELDRKE
jgi:hypothetical protein